MSDQAPGFNRPQVSGDVTAAQESVIAAACPGAVVAPWPAQGEVSPSWGPLVSVSTGYATDPALRFEASSGGAISALAIQALESGLVDRVVHTQADPDRPTRNRTVVSRSAAEVFAATGSRYISSSPLEVIERELAAGGSMAFIGKPCDLSALRRLATVDPRVDRQVPVMLSFFCGGIPSHKGVEAILAALDTPLSEVREFRFRGQGWPGKTRAVTAAGAAEMTYADSWGRHLSKEVQFRCKICPDAVGGVADIACADAWYGGETGYPTFEEQDGRSLIVARTAAGQSLLDAAQAAGRIAREPLAPTEIDLMQPAQARRKRLVPARLAALALTLQPRPRMAGLRLGEAMRQAGTGELVRNLLGTLRRIVIGAR